MRVVNVLPDSVSYLVDGVKRVQQTVFAERELKRIGVVCSICHTESIFDLSADQTANADRACPGCGDFSFLKSFTREGRSHYNWVTYYKTAQAADKTEIRFYFDSKTTQP